MYGTENIRYLDMGMEEEKDGFTGCQILKAPRQRKYNHETGYRILVNVIHGIDSTMEYLYSGFILTID